MSLRLIRGYRLFLRGVEKTEKPIIRDTYKSSWKQLNIFYKSKAELKRTKGNFMKKRKAL